MFFLCVVFYSYPYPIIVFFFFQAEDGIRDPLVTGVQTCALPISKRHVVSGLLRRLRSELKVAAAEVGELDRWQLAEIAIATVSGDGRQADRVLAAALAFIEAHADGARVTDVSTEL